MQNVTLAKLVVAVLMLGIAGVLLWRFIHERPEVSEKAFFYDLSKQKLFTGPRTGVPPIKGIDDAQEDAVRASKHPGPLLTWRCIHRNSNGRWNRPKLPAVHPSWDAHWRKVSGWCAGSGTRNGSR
jgi:hypothetical protein